MNTELYDFLQIASMAVAALAFAAGIYIAGFAVWRMHQRNLFKKGPKRAE